MTKKQLEDHILTYPDSKSKELEVFTRDEIGQIYHISKDTTIREFTPRFSKRQMSTEDITISRVVGCPTIYGCILAYSSMHSDYTAFVTKLNNKDSVWKGGYVIYKLDYEFGLTPSSKLVPDSDYTDEKWLVAYSEQTRTYKPTKVGKIFAQQITYKPTDEKLPTIESTLFIEVSDAQGLQLSKNIKLDKGYWVVELPIWDHQSWKNLSYKDDKQIVVKKIDRDEWLSNKDIVASMLSVDSPSYFNW